MENFESQELPITEGEIIKKTADFGIENPDVKDLLQRWAVQNETVAEMIGTPRAKIDAIVNHAKLYYKLKLNEYWEALGDARRMAFQEGDQEQYDRVMRLMDLADEGKDLEG